MKALECRNGIHFVAFDMKSAIACRYRAASWRSGRDLDSGARTWIRRGGLVCHGQQGFDPERLKTGSEESRAKRREARKKVNEAIRSVRKGTTRPIEPKEAAEGRLDYATVKDWEVAKGGASLDDLRVKNFTTDVSMDASMPFYYRLGKTLELLQSKGVLEVETEKLKPFEEWEYNAESYGTVIVNLAYAHHAIERAVKNITDAFPASTQIGDFEAQAMHDLSSTRGLDRGTQLLRDFQNFVENTPDIGPYDLAPEQTVTTYERYIRRCAVEALDETDTANQVQALCQLIAHVYILRVMHFTSGTRIAAVAVEKLRLMEKRATTAYEEYPDAIDDPVARFMKDIDRVGKLLTEAHKTMVFEELPEAFKMTSVFYAPLAREAVANR